MTKMDAVTLEVIKNALGSMVDEMALIVMRTAYSGVIKDAMDYSTAFCNRKGEMVAQGLTIALHLGSFPEAVRSILTQYGDRLYAGDVFIMNDPYGSGGIHLPDIFVIKPVFSGSELESFSCVVAHHTDVGGIVPGSNSTTATEIYQEGLRIPTLKLFERGVPNPAIFAIIEKNVRVPDKVLGDLRAEIAAANTGERTYQQLISRYGAATLRQYMDELLDYSERLARADIRTLPNGVYDFTDHIDNDSVDPGPVVIHVAITVKDDSVEVDFDGTSPQVRGGINSPLPFSKSAVYAALRLVMDPAIPTSAGYFRPITVRAAEGTVVNPLLPGACGARGITGYRIMDAVLGALAQAIPNRVPAGGDGGNSIISMGGLDARRRPFVYVDLICGSRGAGAWGDGIEGFPHPGANTANTPMEIAELEAPIRFEQYGMVPDSGGAGQHRGALAQVREVRFLMDDALLQLRSDKREFPPYGLAGGRPGTPSANILNPGPAQRLLPTMGLTQIRKDDVLRHVLAGGGGWGDPLDRDPDQVQTDVWNEKLTVAYARREYGVVIHTETLQLDREATDRLRAELTQARVAARLTATVPEATTSQHRGGHRKGR
jgi:N-methylhydantoinase B